MEDPCKPPDAHTAGKRWPMRGAPDAQTLAYWLLCEEQRKAVPGVRYDQMRCWPAPPSCPWLERALAALDGGQAR